MPIFVLVSDFILGCHYQLAKVKGRGKKDIAYNRLVLRLNAIVYVSMHGSEKLLCMYAIVVGIFG
jgi:hypothetical protein